MSSTINKVRSVDTPHNRAKTSDLKKLYNVTLKNDAIKEETSISDANAYDDTLYNHERRPTVLEFSRNKTHLSPEESAKVAKNPIFKEARTIAHIHEFLFSLSYFPFIKIPFKSFGD
jgi:hypothetical protein